MKIQRFLFLCQKILTRKFAVVTLLLTRRCNMQCDYCEVIKRNNLKELEVKQWKRIIDKLSKKYFIFVFSGGESLLYEGVEKLVDYASCKGITGLLTNSLLLDEQRLKKLKKLDFLYFSFDTIAFPRDFKTIETKKLELIAYYMKLYKIETRASIVINTKNVEEIPAIIKLLDKYDIGVDLCLVQVDKLGGLTNDFQYFFKNSQDIANLKELQNRLIGMINDGYSIYTPISYIQNMVHYVQGHYKLQCLAGRRYFTVNNDGFIMACHNLPSSNLNLLDDVNIDQVEIKLKQSIPKNCNCFWDCYYSYSHFANNPLASTIESLLQSAKRKIRGRRLYK